MTAEHYVKKGIRGTFIIAVFTVAASFFGYLTRLFLARTLTPEEFGLFYAVFTLFMFLAIFTDFGYSYALVKFIPEFLVKKNKQDFAKVVTVVLCVTTLLVILVGTLVYLLEPVLVHAYFKTIDAAPLIIFFIFILLVNALQTFIQSFFQALQDMLKVGMLYFMSKLLFFLACLLFFTLGVRGALLPTWAYFAGTLLALLLFIIPFLRRARFTSPLVGKPFFWSVTSFALPNLFTSVAGMVIGYIDTLILTFFVPLSEVGVYNAVLPTALILSYFGSAAFSTLFPLVSELWARKKRALLEQGISKSYIYVLAVVLPFVVAMMFFAELVMRVLFGEAFVVGAPALRLVAFGVIFLSLTHINFSVLNGTGKPTAITKITVAAALFNLFGNILVIPYWGMTGAALTTMLSYIIMFGWSYLEVRRDFSFTLHGVLPVLVSSGVFLAGLVFCKTVLQVRSPELVLASMLASFVVYVILLFGFKVVRLEDLRKFR